MPVLMSLTVTEYFDQPRSIRNGSERLELLSLNLSSSGFDLRVINHPLPRDYNFSQVKLLIKQGNPSPKRRENWTESLSTNADQSINCKSPYLFYNSQCCEYIKSHFQIVSTLPRAFLSFHFFLADAHFRFWGRTCAISFNSLRSITLFHSDLIALLYALRVNLPLSLWPNLCAHHSHRQ